MFINYGSDYNKEIVAIVTNAHSSRVFQKLEHSKRHKVLLTLYIVSISLPFRILILFYSLEKKVNYRKKNSTESIQKKEDRDDS